MTPSRIELGLAIKHIGGHACAFSSAPNWMLWRSWPRQLPEFRIDMHDCKPDERPDLPRSEPNARAAGPGCSRSIEADYLDVSTPAAVGRGSR